VAEKEISVVSVMVKEDTGLKMHIVGMILLSLGVYVLIRSMLRAE